MKGKTGFFVHSGGQYRYDEWVRTPSCRTPAITYSRKPPGSLRPCLHLSHGSMLRFNLKFVYSLIVAGATCVGIPAQAQVPQAPTTALFASHCLDCHQGKEAEAGLDLTKLGKDLSDQKTERLWVRIYDRVHSGEMPPPDSEQPTAKVRAEFLNATGSWLQKTQQAEYAELGRVRSRRLTRREVERSLHALLGVDLPLADHLPEDAKTAGFTTVADGQAMSHFQMERHLAVVDLALDEAFRRALGPVDQDVYQHSFGPDKIVRSNPKARVREPELLNGRAVVWTSGVIFYGRLPVTTAPQSGWYRFKVRAAGLNLPETGGVWCTVNTGLCVSSAPLLNYVTSFEATTDAKEIEFEAWLPQKHLLEIRPGDVTLKRGSFGGGQVGAGEGEPQRVPGVALEEIQMERFYRGASDEELRRLLLGSLTMTADKKGKSPQIVSKDPAVDAKRLMQAFARRAFRRPVSDEQLAGYLALVQNSLNEGAEFSAALRNGYRALLCSPRFLYLTEEPGKLDDHEIAARLSYFLTGGPPDQELMALADAGKLRDAQNIRRQTDRLLSSGGGRQFVVDFAAEWLDLDQIDFTEPDSKLFPEFDRIVQHSMLNETHTFLETMLRQNQSVSRLIAADETFLNSRLARFYDIPNVQGDALRPVKLKAEDHRGGVLTQGAVLKVTANGSHTSPVVRGVWVSEKILGEPIPPPPDNVPAIEPDIRGAKTIREQLAKHRSQEMCASCHVKIDPPGFALESFDPAGQWRDRYLYLASGKRTKGAEIDASDRLPDGRSFADIDEFRRLIAGDPERLAKNLAEKMLVFGTGAPIRFADRIEVDRIAKQAAQDDYGWRSLVHGVVTNYVFLSK